MKLREKLIKLSNTACRITRRLIIYFFFLISSTALFAVLEHNAQNLKFQNLGLIVLSPLAILIAFSGLMYNRARAIDSPPQRFRSLYSAERALSACVLYLAALILGFAITVLLQPYTSEEVPAGKKQISYLLFRTDHALPLVVSRVLQCSVGCVEKPLPKALLHRRPTSKTTTKIV